FRYATQAGITISKNDIIVPPEKEAILASFEERVAKVEQQYARGLITEEERHEIIVNLWTEATDAVADATEKALFELNPIYMMANSGARGSFTQIRQLAGMRGLMANPKGEIIERPIKANFMEGLSVLEYFISTHGARKGLADTALRTADSGYLTRRLVDVAQEVIVREDDCGSDRGLPVRVASRTPDGREVVVSKSILDSKLFGRVLAEPVTVERRTQLTMRTFHPGGVAGEDITHGLPRVVELFEARRPKGEAQITELSGVVQVEDDLEKKVRRITVTSDDGDQVQYAVSFRARLAVADGDRVEVGQQLTEGSVNPHEKLRVEGVQALQTFQVEEVQQVYRSQGVRIHDKHIEIIIRQMLRKVHIIEPGDTEFLPGELVDRKRFEETNAQVVEGGGEPASARPILMGITKASLATDSWLAAASFQETTRVLTEAAISAKSDPLLGLKEHVTIGKLIPAGTGMVSYRNMAVRFNPVAIPEQRLAAQAGLDEDRECGEH